MSERKGLKDLARETAELSDDFDDDVSPAVVIRGLLLREKAALEERQNGATEKQEELQQKLLGYVVEEEVEVDEGEELSPVERKQAAIKDRLF